MINILKKKKLIKREKRYFKKTLLAFTIFFAIYSITLVFPLIWIFLNSMRFKYDFLNKPLSFPETISFKNYTEVFSLPEYNLGTMFFNSVTLVAGIMAVSLFVHACTAYVVAKYRFKGRDIIYFIAIITMFIPTTGSVITLYNFMNDIRLFDTYFGMLLMSSGGFGTTFLIFYGYFKNIPWSYAEAAQIDGAGHFTIFWRIMLPQARSVLIAMGITGAIGVWNDFSTQYLFYPSHQTVSVGLNYMNETIVKYSHEYTKFFATIILCTLPVIALYAAFQKTISTNMAAGGLKG